MSHLSDRYFSKEQLLGIATEKQISQKYFDAFILLVEKNIQQMTDDGELPIDELGEAAVDFATIYFEKYECELQKGHSEEWAGLYAANGEEHFQAFSDTYRAIKKLDSKRAKDELLVHCKALGADEDYTRYFIMRQESGELFLSDPDLIALNYSASYKQQISEGRSELFAHEFAQLLCDLKVNDITYCFWYAKTYEDCLQKGKPERYARLYAIKLAEELAEKYGPHIGKELANDDDCIYVLQKVNAYMDAWEYVVEHKLELAGNFIQQYQDEFLNAYFFEKRDNSVNEEELKKLVLQNVLEKHLKLLGNRNKHKH